MTSSLFWSCTGTAPARRDHAEDDEAERMEGPRARVVGAPLQEAHVVIATIASKA